MNKTFCASGFGRSGTLWLALLADRSPTWSVGHEPGTEVDVASIRRRFEERSAGGNWGEVNSFVLPVLTRLPADRKAVLLRDPRELVVSCVRQGHVFGDLLLNHLNVHLAMIDAAVDAGVSPVSFARMTTEVRYAEDLLRFLGVDDVTVRPEDLTTRANASPGSLTWDQLNPDKKRRVAVATDWFLSKYATLLTRSE